MREMPIRVLVVDDYGPCRSFLSTALQKEPQLRVIGQASDGLEAVQKAAELQPDLILLDIGLPTLNGIEAARRIRKASPASKILFVSENRSPDIVGEALRTGAGGYVVKSEAGRELLTAVEALVLDKPFLSVGLAGHDFSALPDDHSTAIQHCHEVAFYANDSAVADGYSRLIASSLKTGNVVIAVVTESHGASLVPRVEADGVDVAAATEQGRYFLLDAADTLSKLMVDNMPDPVRCAKVLGDLVIRASEAVNRVSNRVVVCGGIAPALLSKGNAEGAITLERLWDEITRGYGVHTLCGYLSSAFPAGQSSPVYQGICGEHSAVHA